MKRYLIVVAGGKGVRMGGEMPKQFQLLGDLNLLHRIELTAGHLLAIAQCGVKDI